MKEAESLELHRLYLRGARILVHRRDFISGIELIVAANVFIGYFTGFVNLLSLLHLYLIFINTLKLWSNFDFFFGK